MATDVATNVLMNRCCNRYGASTLSALVARHPRLRGGPPEVPHRRGRPALRTSWARPGGLLVCCQMFSAINACARSLCTLAAHRNATLETMFMGGIEALRPFRLPVFPGEKIKFCYLGCRHSNF